MHHRDQVAQWYVQHRVQVAIPGDQKHAGFVKLNVDKRSGKQGTNIADYLTLIGNLDQSKSVHVSRPCQ